MLGGAPIIVSAVVALIVIKSPVSSAVLPIDGLQRTPWTSFDELYWAKYGMFESSAITIGFPPFNAGDHNKILLGNEGK